MGTYIIYAGRCISRKTHFIICFSKYISFVYVIISIADIFFLSIIFGMLILSNDNIYDLSRTLRSRIFFRLYTDLQKLLDK